MSRDVEVLRGLWQRLEREGAQRFRDWRRWTGPQAAVYATAIAEVDTLSAAISALEEKEAPSRSLTPTEQAEYNADLATLATPKSSSDSKEEGLKGPPGGWSTPHVLELNLRSGMRECFESGVREAMAMARALRPQEDSERGR